MSLDCILYSISLLLHDAFLTLFWSFRELQPWYIYIYIYISHPFFILSFRGTNPSPAYFIYSYIFCYCYYYYAWHEHLMSITCANPFGALAVKVSESWPVEVLLSSRIRACDPLAPWRQFQWFSKSASPTNTNRLLGWPTAKNLPCRPERESLAFYYCLIYASQSQSNFQSLPLPSIASLTVINLVLS